MKIAQSLFVLFIAFAIVEGRKHILGQYLGVDKDFCDFPTCSCYYKDDTCPNDYPVDCSTTKFCTQDTNKPCCTTDKKFCDAPNCVCVFVKDPCPPDYEDCQNTDYCNLDTNKACCKPSFQH